MHEREFWINVIEQAMEEYRFEDGYKLVFGPWSSLSNLDTAFFTDMPSLNTPENAAPDLISEEEEINTYEKELDTRRPRINRKLSINKQFMLLSKFVKREPIEIMTGVANPFRAENWASLSPVQRQIAEIIGKIFWTGPLLQPSIELIITSGELSTNLILDITHAKLEDSIHSGWDEQKRISVKRYSTYYGKTIVKLPYLGIFKLFGKPECEEPLNKIFDGFINREKNNE